MKCQYVGCRDDSLPGEPFCQAHRIQDSSSGLKYAVRTFGCLVGLVLLMALVVVGVLLMFLFADGPITLY